MILAHKYFLFLGALLALFVQGCATAPSSTEPVDSSKVMKLFYPTGILKSVWVVENGKLNGIKREYTEQGTLNIAANYVDNKIHGMLNRYHPDGSIWTKEIYKQGTLIARKEYNQEGELVSEKVVTE